jgi:hypothetical protein
MVYSMFDRIDLDPASDARANEKIGAERIITREQDGLAIDWGTPRTVFLNPPGGKRGNKSLAALFWTRLMQQRAGYLGFDHAIFLAFSLEQLQTTQGDSDRPPIGRFPFVVPRRRMRFVDAAGNVGPAPSHSNMIVYVPGRVNEQELFFSVFGELGSCINE